MKRKEQLLIFALGRETTPYKAANAFRSGKGKVGLGELGAWYTCKKELLRERYIADVGTQKKSKPIKACVTRYLDEVLKDLPNKDNFEKENLPLFEKHASKIVDFLIKEKTLEDNEMAYPFVFFLFARLLSSVGHHFPTSTQINLIDKVHSFVKNLPETEKRELELGDTRQEVIESLFIIISPHLFKQILVQFGAKIFDAAIFRNQQFDHLINLIDGLETEEDVQFLRDKLEERMLQKLGEAYEFEQEQQAEILEKNPVKIASKELKKQKEASF